MESIRKRKMISVNVRMIPSKICYIFYGIHLGSYVSFLNIFFISVGLTVADAGLLTGLINVAPIITGPLWGYLADKTGYKRLILFILTTGSSAAMIAMPLVAGTIHPYSKMITCNTTKINNSTAILSDETCDQDIKTLFWALFGLSLLASIFLRPLPNFVEAIISNITKSSNDDSSYGAQRFIASISMGVTNYVVGKAAEHYIDPTLSPYTVLFYVYLVGTLMFFPIGCFLIKQLKEIQSTNNSNTSPENRSKERLGRIFRRMFCRFDVNFFFLTVFISGTAHNTYAYFTYPFINDELKRSKSESTYAVTVGILSEMLIFPFAAKIVKTLKGPLVAIIVGTLAHSLRFFIMFLPVPFEVVVGVQALNGIAFGLSFEAFFEQIHILSPPELRITMKTTMLVVFFCGGVISANMAGGKLYQQYGPRKLFLFTSLLCLSFAVLQSIQVCFDWKKKRYNTDENEGETSTETSNETLADS